MNPILLSGILITVIGTFVINVALVLFSGLIEIEYNTPFILLLSFVISGLIGRKYYTSNMPKITIEKTEVFPKKEDEKETIPYEPTSTMSMVILITFITTIIVGFTIAGKLLIN
tara:strand:+ start:550 stop:891 length:342 start_codon:yes stop_codon:yes gene_type:complete